MKARKKMSVSSIDLTMSASSATGSGFVQLTETELAKNADKTNFYLRMSEIVQENSKDSTLIVMTLPLPKMGVPFQLYMAWVDFISRNMPPFLWVRGNQESVLTFYS